ncbi:MscS family membrane protein [Arcticibacter pallidicorallinus]|uniref:MscS family membrane protein n=1 Tax=Arcticibacter pallidicorallinus TaxID=1259464 RepID=A0A2T0U571_9SPHI|nr:mechanosensitive ion channel family protein [Arcticibacter pallidicorallinus]PRY53069.1 MscS family membrane protein [Arcticibacter pallidicorallinus]
MIFNFRLLEKHYTYILFYSLFFFSSGINTGQAQDLGFSKDTTTAVVPVLPPDSLGRSTPRGTVEAFISAVAGENYEKAAMYLRLDKVLKKNRDKVRLAKALESLLNDGTVFPYSLMSNDPAGKTDDNLGPNLERIGTATVNNEPFDILLESTNGKNGEVIWLFSSETIQRLPTQVEAAPIAPLIERVMPDALNASKWGGVPAGHWFGLIFLVLLAYLLAWAITKAVLFFIPLVWRRARNDPHAGIIKAFSLPIQIYLTVVFFVVCSQEAGISIIVRQRFSNLTVVVGLVALLLLLWQLLNTSTRYVEKRMGKKRNQAAVSAVLFLRRAAKIALVFVGIIMVLGTFGFDVTTGIAALGIGGIALALGAQKTVENFVGSVTLIADQPVRVGDFCKVGDVVGTVEQIGMRSTQIRTNDRTVVTIPNGEFSSLKIENFFHRDRFWFHPVFRIRFDATPDQIRYLLVELRAILYAHPKVDPSSARVRFIEIGTDAFKLEVFSYILAADFDRFLEIQEDIYLRMMDVVASSGTGFALSSQTVYLAKEKQPSEEKAAEAHEKVRKWVEDGDLQIPAFDPEYIKDLQNKIVYPPEGSSVYKNEQKDI